MTPTLQTVTQAFYEYEDIQKFLCEKMNITELEFRDFHEVVGGDYKDFWHIWLGLVYDDVTNGEISTVDLSQMIDEMKDEMADLQAYGDLEMVNGRYVGYAWTFNLIPALEALVQEVGDTIDIRYYW
jgi:hypothetical protein